QVALFHRKRFFCPAFAVEPDLGVFYVPRLSIGGRTLSGIALGASLKLVNREPSCPDDFLERYPCMTFADAPRIELPKLLEINSGIVPFTVLLVRVHRRAGFLILS